MLVINMSFNNYILLHHEQKKNTMSKIIRTVPHLLQTQGQKYKVTLFLNTV